MYDIMHLRNQAPIRIQLGKSAEELLNLKLLSSASQAWCLGRFLPLLVGDLVPEGDDKWANYLDLLTILDYIFAPITTQDKCEYLKMMLHRTTAVVI